MWGVGGNHFWGRKETERAGVVVVFAWMFSQEKHLRSYVRLYSSLNWNCLICQSGFLNLFFPQKSERFAIEILNELVKELQSKPCPIVFAPFSGGSKACLYNVLRIINGKSESQLSHDCIRLVGECVSGYIYDSSPVDFVSDLGKRLLLHPSVIKTSQPPKILSWAINGVSFGLDSLFLDRFETQRADYWQTLHSSASSKAPHLIIASENDDLSSYKVICNFADKLSELGGEVKLVTMAGSPHVGHYRAFPNEYTAAVTELFSKAAGVYRRRTEGVEGGSVVWDNGKLGGERSLSCRRDAAAPADPFVEAECFETELHQGSLPVDESSDFLYNVHAPKNVEDWDFESLSSLRKRPSSLNPVKCIWRSRL